MWLLKMSGGEDDLDDLPVKEAHSLPQYSPGRSEPGEYIYDRSF